MQGSEISLHGSEGAEGGGSGPASDAGLGSASGSISHDPRVAPPAPPSSAAAANGARPDDRRIGQVVDGKYLVLRRLACGGMGSVYEARHTVVGRHFALKFLHEQYAQRSSMVQRFLREAQAAGSIASEHIIGVLDYGTTLGTPYLVMELVRGQDLREILADSPRLPAQRAVRIVLDACRGLALAHERGLVHRDLKPANICVTRRSDGREVAKVIDFGVAKLRDGAELSEEGTLIGTLGYMAPEQLTDQRQLDARADVYALGVILYQALAGRPPHICNRSELLYRIVSVDPKPLAELCPELPSGLAQVVHKALCRSKERRYASVHELARALEPYAGEEITAAGGTSERLQPPRAAAPASERGLGTAETEPGNAPTWVALAHATDQRATQKCEPGAAGVAGRALALEQYCRHPEGLPLVPLPAPHHQLSQRALVLSIGALLLSVVAMTTMFVFVYSHGSGALEAAATARASARREAPSPELPGPARAAEAGHGGSAPARPLAPQGAAAMSSEPSPAAGAVARVEQCRPLQRAAVFELGEGEGVTVGQHALQPARDRRTGTRPAPGAQAAQSRCE